VDGGDIMGLNPVPKRATLGREMTAQEVMVVGGEAGVLRAMGG
jgi:hypothetical protein